MTEFELQVLLKLVAGDSRSAHKLQAQVHAAEVTAREWFGTAGFKAFLHVPDLSLRLSPPSDLEIADVTATIEGMTQPTLYVVFILNGLVAVLEGTGFDEPWPDPISRYDMDYIYRPRRNSLLGA